MPYSLKQAADACGRSKSTVWGALKDGKIRHTLDEKGRFRIEPEDLAEWLGEQPQNVQPEREKTDVNDEKNGLFRQKIEFLEQTITTLTDERNQWREQAKAANATIANQAASLATATAASARAITQADEMRRQLLAIEAPQPEPPPPAPVPQIEARPPAIHPVYWLAFGAIALAAAATAPYWLPWWTGKN
ncbi:helix-turn-helix domain-containing protein [Methylomagnum sp.]